MATGKPLLIYLLALQADIGMKNIDFIRINLPNMFYNKLHTDI